MQKLKPNISSEFEIDASMMDSLDFDFEISPKSVKKKTKIIELSTKKKKDGSVGLF